MIYLRNVLATGALALIAAVLIPAASATAPSSGVKNYDACLQYGSTGCSTDGLPGGSTVSLSLTLSNRPESNVSIGSANLTAPDGFGIHTTGVDFNGAAGTVGSGSTPSQLQLRGLSVAPGTSVTVTFQVDVPCASSGVWGLEVKQSNSFNGPPGNDFNAISFSGNPSTIGTSGGALDHFDAALPTSSFTATAGSPFTVTVTAKDKCGNTATGFDGTATLTSTLGAAPNPAASPVSPLPLGIQSGAGGALIGFTNGVSSQAVTAVQAAAAQTISVASGTATGTSASFDVQPGSLGALVVGSVADTTVGTAISPAVTVDAYDAFGNLEACASCSVDVSLAIGVDGAGGGTTLAGAGPLATDTSMGRATFSNVTLDQSGLGFTLRATSGAVTSADSNTFNVYDARCVTPTGYTTCTASKNDTTVTTDYPTPTVDPTLLQLSALGQQVSCGTSTTAIGAVATFTPAGQDTSNLPYTWKNPIAVTLRWDKSLVPGTGVSNFTLCLAKPFVSPWGAAGTYQVVQDCPAKLTSKTLLPCASKRSRNNAGDLVIVLLMGSGDPGAVLG